MCVCVCVCVFDEQEFYSQNKDGITKRKQGPHPL